MSPVAERLAQVQKQIALYAASCNRSPADINLLAVSKTKPVEAIVAAFDAGQRAFAENYLQDALTKISALENYPIEWHFIGRIQSNKTRAIAGHFAWVHTLDNSKHAQRLSRQRPDHLPALQVCIQVNLSKEESKGGVGEKELSALANMVTALPRIRLRGLMTMPDPKTGPAVQQAAFVRLRELKDKLNQQGFTLDTLSMGMSNDMQVAVCAGSTIVRIGTAIFGARA